MENLDRYLFEWINTGMSNSFFDQWMPYFTDLHKQPGFLKVTLPILLITWIIQSRWEVLKVLGVHYPFDILGGALVGYIIAILMIQLARRTPLLKKYMAPPRKR